MRAHTQSHSRMHDKRDFRRLSNHSRTGGYGEWEVTYSSHGVVKELALSYAKRDEEAIREQWKSTGREHSMNEPRDRKMDQKRKIGCFPLFPLQIRIADLFADCGGMIVVDERFFEDPLTLNLSILEHRS